MGLDDVPLLAQVSQGSIMNNPPYLSVNDWGNWLPTNVTACDIGTVNTNPQCATPSPSPTETPTPDPIPIDFDCLFTECWQPNPECACYIPGSAKAGESCPATKERIVDAKNEGKAEPLCICPTSPILIDILGNGYALTSAENGVSFDFNGDGIKKGKMSWTAPNSDDAWLVLDRNGNGTIDSAKEMFGNPTPQPGDVPFNQRNGFIALAEFDKRENGGNPDGGIDKKDSVFNHLRLWQDFNHNGISEPDELKPLPVLGIEAIELDYKESKKTDEFGNAFRFRAKIWDKKGVKAGHWAWDVFLRKAQ